MHQQEYQIWRLQVAESCGATAVTASCTCHKIKHTDNARAVLWRSTPLMCVLICHATVLLLLQVPHLTSSMQL
jgi:hypothetical protein